MANLLYQQIEMLSREKHIEPTVVVSAIEDAMVVAARKHYKTEEDLRAKFNPETGQVDVFSVIRSSRKSSTRRKKSAWRKRRRRIRRRKLVRRLSRRSRPMRLGALRRRRSSK